MKTEANRIIHVTYRNEDRSWLDELVVHLSTGMPDVDVRASAVPEIHASADKQSIAEPPETADAIILLVSDELIASPFFQDVELPEIVRCAQVRGTLVLPILVAPGSRETTRIGDFEFLNSSATALENLSSDARDTAYIGIVDRLNAVLSRHATPEGGLVAATDLAEAIGREIFAPLEDELAKSPKPGDPRERRSAAYWRRQIFLLQWLPTVAKGVALVVVAVATGALWFESFSPVAWLLPILVAALWLWKGRKVGEALSEVTQMFRKHAVYELSRVRALSDERPYFLYLRAFTDSAFSVVTDDVAAPGHQGSTTCFVHNLSEDLERALEPFGSVVMLGAEPSADPFEDPSLMIETSDKDWWEIFASLAEQARAIFLVPGPTGSVLREIDHLLSTGLREKVIVLMPHADSAGRRATRWATLRAELTLSGLELPPYDAQGCLYLPTERLGVAYKVSFDSTPSPTDAIQRAFRLLDERMDASSTPLYQAMRGLQLARMGGFDLISRSMEAVDEDRRSAARSTKSGDRGRRSDSVAGGRSRGDSA